MKSQTKIELRKIVPIVAMISAGKSKFLNVLFNINFLQCDTGIATQFVNILRYNPKIDSPRFYHLKLEKEGEDYIFYKDTDYEVKIGEKDIINENKRINEELKKNKDKNGINYKDIFYITEVKEVEFIKDKEYLKLHDFCDIPGLSELQDNQQDKSKNLNENKKINIKENNDDFEDKMEKGKKFGMIYIPKKIDYYKSKNNLQKKNDNKENNEEKKEKIKTEKEEKDKIEEKKINEENEDSLYYKTDIKKNTYLFEIFTILKNKIDGIIILLSIENYNFDENYSIITKLYKVIKKDITNSLVILNKIDKSSNPKEDIDKCQGLFAKKFPNFKTFNLYSNTFIPLSTYQLQNELLMKKSYEHLLRFHFFNYLKTFRLQQSLGNNYDKSFIDHLRDILRKIKGINKQEIEDKIKELDNSEDIVCNKTINKFIEETEKEFSGDGIKLGIDKIEDEDEDDFAPDIETEDNDINSIKATNVMKIFYIYQKQSKYMPTLSKETKQLLDYFKITYTKKIIPKLNKVKIYHETKLNKDKVKALKNFSQKIKEFKIDGGKIKDLVYDIQKTIEYLETYNVIFIPFLGASNAGKSTIINGIIGKNILPNDLKECTKKGIIIRYSDDEISLRKANFKTEEFSEKTNYFFESTHEICRGEEQVKKALKDINFDFCEDEEDSFYYIRTKIKLFDEIGLNDSLKEMIYLIDFPGYGTGNIFETKQLYKKVMCLCNSFVFVLRNSIIRDNDTKRGIDLIFSDVKSQKKELSSKLLKSSLFVLNNDTHQKIDHQKDLDEAKAGIEFVLNYKERKNINACFFNAKFYLNYCLKSNYYSM